MVELFKMKDIKRFSEEIATKGVINVYFPYIEEIVHAFRDSEVTSPQLYFTFIESIENQFIAAWRYDPTSKAYVQSYDVTVQKMEQDK